jgi:hypothetical protein
MHEKQAIATVFSGFPALWVEITPTMAFFELSVKCSVTSVSIKIGFDFICRNLSQFRFFVFRFLERGSPQP